MAIAADIFERGGGDCEFTTAAEAFIDLPGMILADRKIATFFIQGFAVSFPNNEVEYFMNRLLESPERVSRDVKYYKLHGWLHCLVLTPDMRDELLLDMKMHLETKNESNSATN